MKLKNILSTLNPLGRYLHTPSPWGRAGEGLLFVIFLSAFLSASAADHVSTARLTVKGIKGGTCRWFVEAFPVSPIGQGERKDTLLMKNGRLTYTIKSDTLYKTYLVPEVAVTRKTGYETTNLGKIVELYMVPGHTLIVNANVGKGYTDYTVSGSDINATYAVRESAYRKAHSVRLREIERIMAEDNPDSLTSVRLNDEYQKIGEEHRQSNLKYAAEHPNEQISGAYYFELADDSVIAAIAPKMPKAVRNGLYKSAIDMRVKAYEIENKIRDNRGKVREGVAAPAFTVQTIDGKEASQDMFKGKKYLVLDFWGSWCGWCIKGVPEMKKYHDKYGDRMEILGVDCNDKKEKMLAAIKKHDMNWLHTINADNDMEHSLTLKYGVEAFPTKIIISPDGKIAGYFEGEVPEFYQKLDELMKR